MERCLNLGGEEFMILMPSVDINKAFSVADKLRNTIEIAEIKNTDSFTTSFCVTELYENDTARTFLKRVDDALYETKETGRNKVARSN